MNSDLANYRHETITGSSNTGNGAIVYAYNHDDQLLTETGTYADSSADYQTFYSYDASGNLQTRIRTPGPNGSPAFDFYSYDLRNHMTGDTQYSNGGLYSVTTYSYDYSGTLTSESTVYPDTSPDMPNTTSITYLNDPYNPTGYTKAIEQTTTTFIGDGPN